MCPGRRKQQAKQQANQFGNESSFVMKENQRKPRKAPLLGSLETDLEKSMEDKHDKEATCTNVQESLLLQIVTGVESETEGSGHNSKTLLGYTRAKTYLY